MGARKPASKPAAKPKAAPKPKINVLAAMREDIVQSQLAITKKVGVPIKETPAIPAPKDPKTKKLVDFFQTKPFGCNTEKAIDFAEILHGSEIRKYMPVKNGDDSNIENDPKRKFILPGTIYHNGSEILVITRRDSDGDVFDTTVNNTDSGELLTEDNNHIYEVMNRATIIVPTLSQKAIKETVATYADHIITQIYTMLQFKSKESK